LAGYALGRADIGHATLLSADFGPPVSESGTLNGQPAANKPSSFPVFRLREESTVGGCNDKAGVTRLGSVTTAKNSIRFLGRYEEVGIDGFRLIQQRAADGMLGHGRDENIGVDQGGLRGVRHRCFLESTCPGPVLPTLADHGWGWLPWAQGAGLKKSAEESPTLAAHPASLVPGQVRLPCRERCLLLKSSLDSHYAWAIANSF
jgi:hypothetical protein